MKLKINILFVLIAMLLFRGIATAQIPVEVFVGNKKATVDIMFYKYIKNKEGLNSKFLFFNRNRASIDYEMSETAKLPQFGFTEAISYNNQKLKGFAPVIVVSIFNKGIYPKMGVQFAIIKEYYTIFSWIVSETLKNANIDFFFLMRYTPKLTEKLNLFSQIELVNTFPTVEKNQFSLTQRIRIGLKEKEFQFGVGIDFSQIGRNSFSKIKNFGAFLRYEF